MLASDAFSAVQEASSNSGKEEKIYDREEVKKITNRWNIFSLLNKVTLLLLEIQNQILICIYHCNIIVLILANYTYNSEGNC